MITKQPMSLNPHFMKPIAYLVALDSSLTKREYAIPEKGLTMGRNKDVGDILLQDKTISRRHARVLYQKNEFILVDLQSINGVFVNYDRITGEHILHDGDIISLGNPTVRHFRFQHHSLKEQASSYQLASQACWLIGREDSADICLASDPTVSSKHARIILQKNNKLAIEDLHSLNGTFLNGELVRRGKLRPGDTLVVGSTAFHFHMGGNGYLVVSQHEYSDDISLECVHVQRKVRCGRNKKKTILKETTLVVEPGEFIGILGPSGAGKSTFLKSLCGHTAPSSGCVLLNETPLYRSYEMFRRIIGYVPQDDILHAELSVFDSLDYIARQRLPADTSVEQRGKIIRTTIEELGLSHVQDSLIRQLSGGQRKRVSIGAELITRPSILFLDEPTSGLDPSVEERLMNHFRQMASRGTTVLITTHILYNLSILDKIIFMSQGRLVFYGTPNQALRFFSEKNFPIEKPTRIFDLLEGLLPRPWIDPGLEGNELKDCIATYYNRKYIQSSLYAEMVTDRFSPLAKELKEAGDSGCTTNRDVAKATEILNLLAMPESQRTISFNPARYCSARQWFVLTARHFRIRFSCLKQALVYLLIPVVLALVTLTQSTMAFPPSETVASQHRLLENTLDRAGPATQKTIEALLNSPQTGQPHKSAAEILYSIKYEGVAHLPVPMGMMLMFVMTAVFCGTFIACQELSSERIIRYREQMAGQRLMDYLGSKLVFCFFVTCLQIYLYLGLCVLVAGMPPVPFVTLALILTGLAWVSVTMGLFISSIDPTSGQFSIIMSIIVVLPQLIFSGGIGPDFYHGMDRITQAVADLFPAKWGLEMLFTAIYHTKNAEVLSWVSGFVQNVIGFRFGEDVLRYDVSVLAAQLVVWLALTVFSLHFITRKD